MKDKEKNGTYNSGSNTYSSKPHFASKPRKEINSVNLPNFFDVKEYKILNPYNFTKSLERLEQLDEESLMNDMEGFCKKDFELEHETDDRYKLELENLMIFTDWKEFENEGNFDENNQNNQNFHNNFPLNFVRLIDFSKYLNSKSEKKIELRLENYKKKEIYIKLYVDFDEISKNINSGYENSPFEKSSSLVKKAKLIWDQLNSSEKKQKFPELDITIKFNMVKKIIETQDETCLILELTNPPLFKTNFLKIPDDGARKNDYENILFPFRNFQDEIANLKYRKFYFMIKAPTSAGNDININKIDKLENSIFDDSSNSNIIRSLVNVITNSVSMIERIQNFSNFKIFSENELRKKLNIHESFEIANYFSPTQTYFYKQFSENFRFDEASLVSFNYQILVAISENILSYFNAILFIEKIFKYPGHDYFRHHFDNEDFNTMLFSEALIKLVDLFKNSGRELTVSYFEQELISLYRTCKLEWEINGDAAFKKKNKRLIRNQRILVTPTYTLFLPYIEDQGNRILREHRRPWEAMRVVFKMDDFQDAKWNNKFLIEFIKIHLIKGINLSNLHFEFFCYSQSQFRSMGCWLVTNPDEILKLTGDYSNIKIIAKYGARVGQTLTSTTKTIRIHEDNIFDIPECTGNTNYVFSDGVGTITEDLAEKISRKLGLDNIPAAFQGRFLGCKGVWTVLFGDFSTKICIRPSQKKFEKLPEGDNQRFEVCGYSKFIKSYLNRQIILLLSALGIEDEVFIKKLYAYRNRLEDEKFILSLIHYDEWNSMFMKMHLSGVNRTNDRLVRSIVSANKEILYRDLKKKARIYIEEGAYVTGIMDEFGILNYGEAFLHVKTETINMIVDKSCPVAKCPCLHPGDIRVLNFKKFDPNDPETKKYQIFESYENVIIFPQKGPRPHPNELSGSDLDGDQYFIFYDLDLRNVKRVVDPMDYSDNSESIKKDHITRKDIIDFFAEFINNNNLGLIADAHLAHSDRLSADGELPKNLAKKFSLAVDAPKTGAKIILTENEEAKEWPHYMGREKKTFHSTHVLGKLYDKTVKIIEEIDKYKSSETNYYDEGLLVPDFMNFAFEGLVNYIKYYEELLGILKKNDVQCESELLTGNNVDNEQNGFGKKKHNYDIIERISIQMKEIFSKYKGYFYNSSQVLFDKNGINYQLRNSQTKRASAFYYVCYDMLQVIEDVGRDPTILDEMKNNFENVIFEDFKFNNENDEVNQYQRCLSDYNCLSLGGDFADSFYYEDAYMIEIEKEKAAIREKLENWKKIIIHFIKEKTKVLKIPKKVNEENQFRILSFPWCSAGDILIKIKDLVR